VDDLGGSGASFGSADPDTDVDVNEGLGASEKADFKGSTLSAGAGVATFEKEKGVAVSAVWVAGFVLCSGTDKDVPNPGKAVVAPPNRGLGARPASPFSDNCGADRGVRLNGSELVDDCVDDVDWIG